MDHFSENNAPEALRGTGCLGTLIKRRKDVAIRCMVSEGPDIEKRVNLFASLVILSEAAKIASKVNPARLYSGTKES